MAAALCLDVVGYTLPKVMYDAKGLCGEDIKESVGIAQKAKTIRIPAQIMLSEPFQPSNLHTRVLSVRVVYSHVVISP